MNQKDFKTSILLIRSSTKIYEFDKIRFPQNIKSKDGVWREFLKIDSSVMSSKRWILRKREFSYTFSQSISYNHVVDIKQIYFSSTLLKLWVHISDTVAGVIGDPQYY